MGIPVYWSLAPSVNPPAALKPTLKRTRPLPSSIRRQPHARDPRPLYSEIARRQPTDEEDCPFPVATPRYPRVRVPRRERPHETNEFIEQLEAFSNSSRVHSRPSHDRPVGESLQISPQLPPTGPPLSIQGVPELTDGIPMPIPEPNIPELPSYSGYPPSIWRLYTESMSSVSSPSDVTISTSPSHREPNTYQSRDPTPFDGFGVPVESVSSSDDGELIGDHTFEHRQRAPVIYERLDGSDSIYFDGGWN
jgi:hypothetical protein